MTQGKSETPRPTLRLERTYAGTVEDVWALWTTKEGIESWWGPEGFAVKVLGIDLRPGGVLDYEMSATGAEQVAFMKRAGMPVTTRVHLTYVEVKAPNRLAYVSQVDFVPGVAPYPAGTRVELSAKGAQVQLVVTLDAMHDAEWTGRAVMGWESQLTKLDRVLA